MSRTPGLSFHRATGRYFVRLSGKCVYLGRDKKTAAKLRDRVVSEWLAKGRAAPPTKSSGLTVAGLLDAYRRHADEYYRLPNGEPSSELEWIRPAAKALRELYGSSPAAEFGPLKLEAVRLEFIKSGFVRTAINGRIDRLRRIFKWGVSRELIPSSVYESLRSLPGLRRGRSNAKESEPVRPVAQAVVDQTLPHLNEVVGDMVRLQLLTAARPSEICNLRPCDVDRSGEVWVYRPFRHKTAHHNRERVILIGPKGQAILAKYLLRDSSAYCFSPAEAEQKFRERKHAERKTPIQHGNRPGLILKVKPKRRPGQKFLTTAYNRAVARACERAFNMPKDGTPEERKAWRAANGWHVNQLRHAAATDLRRRFGIETARTVLGHSELSVTEIYAERDLTSATAIMREVG
jgi:integrase